MGNQNLSKMFDRIASVAKRFVASKGSVAFLAVSIVGVTGFVVLGAAGLQDGAIRQDIEAACSDSYPSAGEFDAEGTWKVESVDIVSKEKRAVEPAYAARFGNSYYEVMADVNATNGHVDSIKTVSCEFVKYQGEWQMLGTPGTESETRHALEGPDAGKIAASASRVLQRVDNDNRSYELQPLYMDITPKVDDVAFDEDAQTANTTLRFERSDSFSSSRATIKVEFAFERGTWMLKDAKADASAAGESHDELVGTWKGAFSSTTANQGNCFGAQDSEFILKIDSVDSESGKIEGSFRGIAHYHAYLDTDADSSEGDTDTGEIPFVATLTEGGAVGKNYEGMVAMEMSASYTAPETADGKVHISFGFGTKDDPNAAIAKLTTKANKAKGYRDSALFEDTYTLTKVED